MSRWLNQVNNLLERLDGQVESTVVGGGESGSSVSPLIETVSARTAAGWSNLVAVAASTVPSRRARRKRPTDQDSAYQASSDDDYSDDDDEYEEDNDEEEPDKDYGESNDGDDEFEQDVALYDDEQATDNSDSIPVAAHTAPAPTKNSNLNPREGSEQGTTKQAISDDDTVSPNSNSVLSLDANLTMSQVPSLNPGLFTDKSNAIEPVCGDILAGDSESLADTPPDPSNDALAVPTTAVSAPPLSNLSSRKQITPPGNSNKKMSKEASTIKQLKQQHSQELAQLVAQNQASLQHVVNSSESELGRMRQSQQQLQMELSAVRRELHAVQAELAQAADTVATERAAAQEERDELLCEQEDELQQLKREYEGQLHTLRQQLRQAQTRFQEQWSETERERVQRDESLAGQLLEAQQRTKELEQTVQTLETSRAELQHQVDESREQSNATRQQLQSVRERLQVAERTVLEADERYDTLVQQHKSQLQQRLHREAALEQTVAELSRDAAVAATSNVDADMTPAANALAERDQMAALVKELRERLHVVTEELEARTTDCMESQERGQALERALSDVTQERQTEVAALQTQLQSQEARLHAVTHAHQRLLEQSARVHDTVAIGSIHGNTEAVPHQQLARELDLSKQQVATLSDQLRRQQGQTETYKSELLALKGRLQAAMVRAEAAEQHPQQQLAPDHLSEIELGTSPTASSSLHHRRRVKGGRHNAARLGPSTKTIRNALGWPRHHSAMPRQKVWLQHVGDTMDALDVWMLQTGGILRHEPLARLGFAVYMAMIHVWCFALIMFHTIEAEHGDLGYLTHHQAAQGPK
jgi:chromosome segregation ATPase